jgi:hypothetical protein
LSILRRWFWRRCQRQAYGGYGWKAIIWCRRSTPGNAAPIGPRALSRNHVYWRGGQLAFGKVTMAVTALELVDLDTEDPFDFSVDNWNAPLVAGYSKMLPNQGLRAWMPDFADRR